MTERRLASFDDGGMRWGKLAREMLDQAQGLSRAIRPSTSHCDGSAHAKTTEQPLAGRGPPTFQHHQRRRGESVRGSPNPDDRSNPAPVGFLPAKDFPNTMNQDTITQSMA